MVFIVCILGKKCKQLTALSSSTCAADSFTRTESASKVRPSHTPGPVMRSGHAAVRPFEARARPSEGAAIFGIQNGRTRFLIINTDGQKTVIVFFDRLTPSCAPGLCAHHACWQWERDSNCVHSDAANSTRPQQRIKWLSDVVIIACSLQIELARWLRSSDYSVSS
jgi:hypothetical protein